MSRLVRLPDAERVELVDRTRDHDGAITEKVTLIGEAFVNVGSVQSIYADDATAVVEINNNRCYRFVMADENAATEGVRTLTRIASGGR